MAIQLLDQTLINKIAAGEVIERPASVVKELVENSLDAGATSVYVEIVEGGKSLIKVMDNGSGMGPRDIELCIESHATSKIQSIADLFNITTLGFRGEALASIAAVSNMKIASRTSEFLHGNFMEVEGGIIKQKKEVSANIGTTIEITDLFFNTPARKKYLDTIQNEANRITDLIIKFALINPSVSFRLTHNDRIILYSPSTRDNLGNILNIYGKDTAKQLIPVKFSKDKTEIEGFVSKPSLTRSDKTQQSFYVNKRPISSSTIASAVHDAYGNLLFSHRFPVVILSIYIDPSKIDVNVHPTKKEIRFSNEQEIYGIVNEAVKAALEDAIHIPEVSVNGTTQMRFAEVTKAKQIVADKFTIDPLKQSVLEPVSDMVSDQELPNLKILGLVHNCYIVAENEDGMCIIDQHAAEERVNYEIFHKQYESGYIKSQQLVIPTHIELSPTDASILRENLNSIKRFGFDIEDFGTNSFLARATPVIMGRQMSKGVIIDMVDELNANKITKFEEVKDKIIARMACRQSIKQGDRIEIGYMTKLLSRLYTCDQPFTCPHGRPTMINIPKGELERKFKRTG
ncbi:MAG: DNA mismatch repair endonuclease MutL [Candidatus Woesearchaeota archaeon]